MDLTAQAIVPLLKVFRGWFQELSLQTNDTNDVTGYEDWILIDYCCYYDDDYYI